MNFLWPKMLILLILLTGMIVSIWYIYSYGDATPVTHASSRTCSNTGFLELYNHSWTKQKDNFNRFRSELNNSCHGETKAIITQDNTPVGTLVEYDGEKNTPLKVTPNLFNTFSKEQPFKHFPRKTCAVVGNGGILVNSSCGDKINSAQFVIRCNLPPLGDSYTEDVGNKTDLVTANPSILFDKSVMGLRRHPFVERMSNYGNSLLLLPAFSYSANTAVSLRAFYTLQEFGSPARPVFLNPEYLSSLARFWKAQGLDVRRLSTGFMMASLALELCPSVHLYGFWPFPWHPHRCHPLTNHYYDDQMVNKVHNMAVEFEHLLRLHKKGVAKVHLGEC